MNGRQGYEAQGAVPGWALADDIFQQRYRAGTSHTEGAWQPLPQLSLQLDSAAAPNSGNGLPQRQQQQRGGSSSAAAAPPQQEPWLLAAGAYAAEASGGWAAAGGKPTRARMLFQYKPYSQQDPLALGDAEVAAVVEAVFGRLGSAAPSAFQDSSSSLWDSVSAGAMFGLSSAATTGEVAAVILIKLVMDLYVSAGPRAAFPLTLLLLQNPLLSGDPGVQCRVFDVLYNLSVHGELLYDTAAEAMPADAAALADAVAELDFGDAGTTANWKATVTSAFRTTLAATMKSVSVNPRGSLDGNMSTLAAGGGLPLTRSTLDSRGLRGSVDGGAAARGGTRLGAGGAAAEWPPLLGQRPAARCVRAERFQQWLRLLLLQLMSGLAASSAGGLGASAAPEAPWVAALSCLLHLSTHSGRVVRSYIEELPLSVVSALLEQARRHCWSEQLHAWLISLAANLMYVHADPEESGVQRSVKSVSLRSDGAGSAAGSMHRASYPGGGSHDLSWWAGSQLDLERLAAFGGMRHVLQCYREGPTIAARRNMFAVIYDYVTCGQRPARQDAWAPVLMHPAHSSETLALGAALLRMGAAEAVHPLFLAGVSATWQHLADAVSVQMASLQAANPGRVVSVPAAMVAECMECLEEMAGSEMQVPSGLQEAVKLTLEAVSAPEAAPSSLAGADARAVWGCLADCMRDGSEVGSRAGRGWLLQLLVAAAEHELARGGGGGASGGANGGGGEQQEAAWGGSAPALALLPEVSSASGARQLEGRQRGMTGQDGLRELLMRALATTPDYRAADCFISAVGSLLVHLRLRCAAAGWEHEEGGWPANGSNSAADLRTPLPPSASAARLSASASAHTTGGGSASLSPSPHAHARKLSQAGPAGRSVESLPDAETSAVRVVPTESVTSGAHSAPYDGQGGMWRTLNCSEAVVATLSLAVEWLLQAPLESRQAAMLQATQLLLAFTLCPRRQRGCGGGSGSGGPSLALRASSSGALQVAGADGVGMPGSPAGTPAGRMGSAAAAQQAQHRLASQAPAPLQIPPSPGMSPSGPDLQSPAGLSQRPMSPSLAALKAAAASAAASSAAASSLQRPGTPRASSFEHLSAAAVAGEAGTGDAAALQAAAAAAAAAGEQQLLEEAAAAVGEASATLLWTFLNGGSMVPQDLLRLVPPLLLRTLFEDLRPDSSALHYDALAAAGAGAPAARLTKAADTALGVKAAVQADRPLWDARAAVLLLLMGRCAADPAALRTLGGTAFFSGLLAEPDVRVRHYSAVFVLRQLMLQQPLQYRRALRGVVARAQGANDENLLANPYLQLRAMLDQGRVQLDQLA